MGQDFRRKNSTNPSVFDIPGVRLRTLADLVFLCALLCLSRK